MSDEKPPYRDHSMERKNTPLSVPTVRAMDAAPAWAIKMQESIIAKQDANHQLVVGEMEGIKGRLDHLEDWKRQTGKYKPVILPDGTTTTPSGFIKRVSESDASQNLDIASLKADILVVQQAQADAKTERDDTAKKVAAIHDAVISAGSKLALFWNSQPVKIVRAVVTAAIITYAAARGIHIGN